MIHHYNHKTLVVLVLFTVPFYHFSFSRYLELGERHFSSDILVPFPDSGVLYSRDNATHVAIACHKTCFILWCAIVARLKDLWCAIKNFWDIISYIYNSDNDLIDLVAVSSEECSKSKHLNGGLPTTSSIGTNCHLQK